MRGLERGGRPLALGLGAGAVSTLMLLAACDAVSPEGVTPRERSGVAAAGRGAQQAAAERGQRRWLGVPVEALREAGRRASLRVVRNVFAFGAEEVVEAAAAPTGGMASDVVRPATGPALGAAAASGMGAGEVARAPLHLIGVVEAGAGLVAVLRGGFGVSHGRAGDVVEGRYRIVAVAAASVTLAPLWDAGAPFRLGLGAH